jgi:hypothetical protein
MRELIKGWLGEKMTTFGMRMRLDSEVYRRVHNVIIPAGNGTTQIDHILVSRSTKRSNQTSTTRYRRLSIDHQYGDGCARQRVLAASRHSQGRLASAAACSL